MTYEAKMKPQPLLLTKFDFQMSSAALILNPLTFTSSCLEGGCVSAAIPEEKPLEWYEVFLWKFGPASNTFLETFWYHQF